MDGTLRACVILPNGFSLQGDAGTGRTNNNQAHNNFDWAHYAAGHAGLQSGRGYLGALAGGGSAHSETNDAHFRFLGGGGSALHRQ
jgi:hypothetical protein